MFRNMFMVEHVKIFRQNIFWIETGLLAGIAVLMQILLFATLQIMPGQEQSPEALAEIRAVLTWPGALVNLFSLSSPAGLGSMMVIILVGAVTSQEYHWRTLHLWLGHGVSRSSYAAARLLALALPVLAMLVTVTLVGGLTSAVLSLALDGSLHLDQVDIGQVVLSLLRTAFSLLPYASLAYLLAIATRSAVAAISSGLAFSFLVENVLGQVFNLMGGAPALAARYLPLSLASSVLNFNQAIATTTPATDATGVPAAVAVIGLLLYSLLFFSLAALLLRRQDLA